MLLGQIEAFVQVARHGNLTRAAEAMFLTQPALTARIQALERDLGEPLFVRTRRGLRLSDAGHAFQPWAKRALQAVQDGREAVASLRSRRTGRLVLGAAPAVSTYVLPHLLCRFAEEQPEIEVAVRTGHSEEVLELVLRDEVQLGLVRLLRHPEIEVVPLYEDELILVAAPRHPFAAAPAVQLADLGSERLVLFDRASSYYDTTRAFFRGGGVTPRAVMELDNIESAKKMVELNLGIALLPRVAVRRELAAGLLVAVEIADAQPLRRVIAALRRLDAGPPVGTVRSFMALLYELPKAVADLPPAEPCPDAAGPAALDGHQRR